MGCESKVDDKSNHILSGYSVQDIVVSSTSKDDDVKGKARSESDYLIVSDSTWQGVYGRETNENSDPRQWLSSEYGLFGFMGIHAADVGIGYSSGTIVIDLSTYLVHFPVDASTFVIYEGKYDPSYSENMHASVIPFPAYDECPDTTLITASGGGTENPLRCFAEDKDYIYAWREYPAAGGDGYELVRKKK